MPELLQHDLLYVRRFGWAQRARYGVRGSSGGLLRTSRLAPADLLLPEMPVMFDASLRYAGCRETVWLHPRNR
jgi:hypothetical protein